MKTKECMNKSKVHALILLLALAVLAGGLWAMSSDAAYAGSEGDDGTYDDIYSEEVDDVYYTAIHEDPDNNEMWAAATGRASKSIEILNIKDSVNIMGNEYAVVTDFLVTSIGDGAFSKMQKLAQVTIGENVTSIGKDAFSGNSKLQRISIESDKLAEIGENAFSGIADNALFLVPDNKVAAYKEMLLSSGAPKGIEVKSEPAVLKAEYKSNLKKFITDKRWKNGAHWQDFQGPKLSPCDNMFGCAGYTCDFTQYVFGKVSPFEGKSKYKSVKQIKAGDVVNLNNSAGHWICVIAKKGKKLKVAEGNYADKVRIGWNYRIKGNKIAYGSTKCKIRRGYRMF